MLQQMSIEQLSSVDIQAVSKEDLVDVSGTTFDNSIPRTQRIAQIFQITGNPYCFRVGDLCVKLEFLDSAPPLQDAFSSFLQRKKSGV
mgnify:CR=1 FL=1|jgi:hypothetical protein